MITSLSISSVVSQIAGALWGWPMVALLLGTHIFLTIRLKFPQRKLIKAIKLSFTKDKGSSGDVSQFAALATSLAATIGTGRCRYSHISGWSGCRFLVLDHRSIWYSHKILRRFACRQIQG